MAVGLGHFGAQYDDRDGKGGLLGGILLAGFGVDGTHAVIGVAGYRPDDGTKRPTHGKPRGTTQYFPPDTHVPPSCLPARPANARQPECRTGRVDADPESQQVDLQPFLGGDGQPQQSEQG